MFSLCSGRLPIQKGAKMSKEESTTERIEMMGLPNRITRAFRSTRNSRWQAHRPRHRRLNRSVEHGQETDTPATTEAQTGPALAGRGPGARIASAPCRCAGNATTTQAKEVEHVRQAVEAVRR